MNMNCCRDHSSERKQKILPWITMITGLTLTTFVVVLLTQLINLSRNVDVSRRTLSEMSGRLQKIQKDNDDMKKELRNTKSKMEKILRKFPSAQKVSVQVRRTARAQGARHNRWPPNNVTRNCACEPTVYIHVHSIDRGEMLKHWKRSRDQNTLKIAWTEYEPNFLASLPDQRHIKIERNGTYGVYCNLRMNTTFIEKVGVWLHHHQGKHKNLFYYTLPSHSSKASHEVRFFGLVSIRKPGSKLFVNLQFTSPNPWEDMENTDKYKKFDNYFSKLFSNEANNTFGVFSVQ